MSTSNHPSAYRVLKSGIMPHFWPRSFRFGSRYSQKCSFFSQKRIKCSRVPSPRPLTLKVRRTNFADFCTDILSRIFLPVSWQIFYIYDTQISTENIYRILKVVGNEKEGGPEKWKMIDIYLGLWWSMSVCLCIQLPSSFKSISFSAYSSPIIKRWPTD